MQKKKKQSNSSSQGKQIDLFEVLKKTEDIYFNAMGEPLPWEAHLVTPGSSNDRISDIEAED